MQGLVIMKLLELFSQPDDSGNKDDRLDPEINYLEDLKFFIDNNNNILSKLFFPAITKHKKQGNTEDSYKLYIEPVKKSIDIYCKKYELDDFKDKIFSDNAVLDISKKFAQEQNDHIQHKDYD